MRWIHQYSPELDKRVRCHLKKTDDSWRVDETYVKVKGKCMYLYRVDFEGNTIGFYLSKNRNAKSAKRFLKKALVFCHFTTSRMITVDRNQAYPIKTLHEEKSIPVGVKLMQIQYLKGDTRAILNPSDVCTLLQIKEFILKKYALLLQRAYYEKDVIAFKKLIEIKKTPNMTLKQAAL